MIMKRALLLGLAWALVACVTPDDPNAAAKQGAAGGAIIGLTAGILMGDADLAVKGAIAGGVSGGVAGSMEDLNASREDRRTDTLAGAIASGNSAQDNSGAGGSQQPADWDKLNSFIGNWTAKVFALDSEGHNIDVTATAEGSLISTTEAQVNFDNVVIEGQENPMTGRLRLGYTPATSYSLVTDFALQGDDLVFAGEFTADRNLYTFYPTGTLEGQAFTNEQSSNALIELRFVGDRVVIMETFIRADGEYVKVQSLNMTRVN